MGPPIHVWCKEFACGQESVAEDPGHAASNQQHFSGIYKLVDRRDKCSSEYGRYMLLFDL